MTTVLVAYASAKGSTAEVAEEIGRVLREHALEVVVADVASVEDLRGYDVILLGSAIHSGAWLPPIGNFCRDFAPELAEKPVYLWITCIRILEQYGEQHALDYYFNFNVINRINVQDRAVFAGKLELSDVDWSERWTLAVRYDGALWPSNLSGDFRDWEAIRAWANKVGTALKA